MGILSPPIRTLLFKYRSYRAADVDARTYIAAVEAADGQPLENAVRQAMDNLFIGVKADNGGNLSSFSQLVLLAGPRTVAGCMRSLTGGTNPTAVNFVSGDYNRRTGFLGDAATKNILTGIPGTAFSQNNVHMFAWLSQVSAFSANRLIMGNTVATGSIVLTSASTQALRVRAQSLASDDVVGGAAGTGLKGFSRSIGASYTARTNAADSTVTRASEAPGSANVSVFGNDFDGRIAAFGLGVAITLSAIESRLQTYLNALAAAGI